MIEGGETRRLNRAAIFKWIYWVVTTLWVLFCFVGTFVGLSYHSLDPIAPQILEGFVTATIPPVLLYLILRLFRLFE
jgi:hypothetical protein